MSAKGSQAAIATDLARNDRQGVRQAPSFMTLHQFSQFSAVIIGEK